ncbi:ABC transporter permease [Collinsella sp. zg1085]|uniref:ABC transporter permease n=1 Tax=Collinsella sp. zg1085 TaxID=2844380 RepID=UPI001C0E1B5E|nr:ABC transporter permease [Collinsella sp. zg1085]QWT17398.1 ABC transporter permease [Collinsella sp. zg1085]
MNTLDSRLIRLLKRPVTSTFLAVLCGFVVAAILLTIAGFDPHASFAALFEGVFSKPKYISQTIIKAAPIILTGISVAFAFKTGLFNIGAEGQYIAGTICAVLVGAKLDLPMPLQIPLVILAGIAGGACIGAIAGGLKARFGIHEVITSIMLNWTMLYLNNFVVNLDAYHQPSSISSIPVNPSSFTTILPNWKISPEGLETLKQIPWLYDFLVKTDVNIAFAVALLVAALAWFILYRSKLGFELRAVGAGRDAAEFAGMPVARNTLLAMAIAGGISGLAGTLMVTGISPHSLSTLAGFENYGFNGFSVALIASSSPIGCIFAGLLFGGLIYGGQSVQIVVGAPTDIINIMIGTIVFFVALARLIPMAIHLINKRQQAKRGASHAQ